MNFIKLNRQKNKGFTLLELILVLGIGSMALLGMIQMEQIRQENLSAESAGGEMNEVGQALAQYINLNNSLIQGVVPSGGVVTVPLAALQSSVGQALAGVNNKLLLPTAYTNKLPFQTIPTPITFNMYIRNNAGTITGLVLTNSAVIDKTGAIRYDWTGTAMKKAGNNAGISFALPTTINGMNGMWQLDNTSFPAIGANGLLAYRVAYQATYDSTYLRLDGMYPMIGNLNMGNYNIKNATDISYSGWLYGNNGVMNNLLTGTITNAGTVTTLGVNGKTTLIGNATVAAAITHENGTYAGGNASFGNFDLLYANCINCGIAGEAYNAATPGFSAANGDVKIGGNGTTGKLFVSDVLISNNGSSVGGTNGWLSDRLSRYSDRGVAMVADGGVIAKPAVVVSANGTGATGYVCRWTGQGLSPVAKIEVIPALQWVQGAVLGPMTLSFAGSSISGGNQLILNGSITQNQYSVGSNAAYATNLGASWQIHVTTPTYLAGAVSGTAIVHVYCDYGT